MALTPEEQRAKNAGWALPEGDDLISGGDDAIRKNATKARDEIAEGDTATLAAARTYAEEQIDALPPIPTTDLATPTNDGIMPKEAMSDIAPIEQGQPDQWRVTDLTGAIALAVTDSGSVRVAGTEHRSSMAPYRVTDEDGHIAFEVDSDGRTHIYDFANDGSGGGVPTTLHLFVAAGQSNMSGRGKPVEAPVSRRIMQYGANRRVLEQAPVILDMVDSPSGTSPALFFAHHYLATQPSNVGVLLVPAARGGTAFVGTPEAPASAWTWTPGAAPSPDYALYERSVEQTQEAIAAAEAEGYHVIIKGVLWHQGEGNGSITDYAERFDPMVESYRADLEHPTLPVMVGQMCPEGMAATPGKYNVDAAHQDTPYRVPFTGFAPATWDGHNEGDTTHFSTVGTAHLGDTYLTAYTQAVGNTHPHLTPTDRDDDTGWIDVTDDMREPAISGRMLVKRVGYEVKVIFDNLEVEPTGTKTLFLLPDGFRPFWETRQSWFVPSSTQDGGTVNILTSGTLIGYSLLGTGTIMTANMRFETEQAFPY